MRSTRTRAGSHPTRRMTAVRHRRRRAVSPRSGLCCLLCPLIPRPASGGCFRLASVAQLCVYYRQRFPPWYLVILARCIKYNCVAVCAVSCLVRVSERAPRLSSVPCACLALSLAPGQAGPWAGPGPGPCPCPALRPALRQVLGQPRAGACPPAQPQAMPGSGLGPRPRPRTNFQPLRIVFGNLRKTQFRG